MIGISFQKFPLLRKRSKIVSRFGGGRRERRRLLFYFSLGGESSRGTSCSKQKSAPDGSFLAGGVRKGGGKTTCPTLKKTEGRLATTVRMGGETFAAPDGF